MIIYLFKITLNFITQLKKIGSLKGKGRCLFSHLLIQDPFLLAAFEKKLS